MKSAYTPNFGILMALCGGMACLIPMGCHMCEKTNVTMQSTLELQRECLQFLYPSEVPVLQIEWDWANVKRVGMREWEAGKIDYFEGLRPDRKVNYVGRPLCLEKWLVATDVWKIATYIDRASGGTYYTVYFHQCELPGRGPVLLRLALDPFHRRVPRPWISTLTTPDSASQDIPANGGIINMDFAQERFWPQRPTRMSIYGGRPDPLNPSRFTIPYIVNDHQGEIICTLKWEVEGQMAVVEAEYK